MELTQLELWLPKTVKDISRRDEETWKTFSWSLLGVQFMKLQFPSRYQGCESSTTWRKQKNRCLSSFNSMIFNLYAPLILWKILLSFLGCTIQQCEIPYFQEMRSYSYPDFLANTALSFLLLLLFAAIYASYFLKLFSVFKNKENMFGFFFCSENTDNTKNVKFREKELFSKKIKMVFPYLCFQKWFSRIVFKTGTKHALCFYFIIKIGITIFKNLY